MIGLQPAQRFIHREDAVRGVPDFDREISGVARLFAVATPA